MKLLEGIKIVDFTQAHACSLCTMILADFGAEVIKIERPGVGDLARFWAPFKNDASGCYAYLNRNKNSISVDGSSEEGRKIKEIIANMLISGSAGLIFFFGIMGGYQMNLREQGILDVPGMLADGRAEEIALSTMHTLPLSKIAMCVYLFVIVLFLATTMDAISQTLSTTIAKKLDENGELPLELQAKLLHTIQEEEILPVGSTVPVKLDVRMVYATNCDLKNMIRAGRFRQDFYQRINMLEVAIPPLRERREDLRLLTSFFLNRYNHRYARAVDIDEDVRRIFDYYDWPGNVRELSNVIERGVITAPGSLISVQQLPESFFSIDNIDTRKRFVGGSLEEEIDSFPMHLF